MLNCEQSPEYYAEKPAVHPFRVATVDATAIALETIRRDIPSTLIIGAIIKATDIVDLEDTKHLVKEKLGAKLRAEIVDANVTALQRAYDEVKEG